MSILVANIFCRSACKMFLMNTVIAIFNTLSLRGRSRYTADFAAPPHPQLWWGTGVSGNFSANSSCTRSVYLLPSRKTHSKRKTRSSIERTTVSKNDLSNQTVYLCCTSTAVWQLNAVKCHTTITHFNGNFHTDNQINVPVAYPGIFSGGFNKFSWRKRRDRTGIWGR